MEQRAWESARASYLPPYLEKKVESALRRCDDLAVRRGIDKIFEYELALLRLDAEDVRARGDANGARRLLVQASCIERDVGRHVAKALPGGTRCAHGARRRGSRVGPRPVGSGG